MKRISYHWLFDTFYAWIVISLAVNAFAFFIRWVESHPSEHLLFVFLIVNLFLIPAFTFFEGLQPILVLRTMPDTLYILDKKTLCFKNKEIIPIENIETVHVHPMWRGSTYYVIVLNVIPDRMKNKRRKTLVAVDVYDIRKVFQSEETFLKNLRAVGLEERRIQREKWSYNIFGSRGGFKK